MIWDHFPPINEAQFLLLYSTYRYNYSTIIIPQLSYWTFWVAGYIYTTLTIYQNIENYFQRRSTITQSDMTSWEHDISTSIAVNKYLNNMFYKDDDGSVNVSVSPSVFPKIIICSDSMHSRHKLQMRFPFVNITTIEYLYGHNLPKGARSPYLMKELGC